MSQTTTPAVYIAYTGRINPPNVEPVLTRDQVWKGLEIKIEEAEAFVPVLSSTDVISQSVDNHGRPVTVREVVFKEGNRRVREEVTAYYPTKVVFLQPDGSRVQNIVSFGPGSEHAGEELFMTYDFEWLHEGADEAKIMELKKKYTGMSKMAVESSIEAIRQMVKNGRIK